jgi:hypothetical protein
MLSELLGATNAIGVILFFSSWDVRIFGVSEVGILLLVAGVFQRACYGRSIPS